MPLGRLTAVLAMAALRDCLGSAGRISPSKHFLDELTKEGLTIPDAWLVLKQGVIYDPPEEDIKTGDWKYRIEGKEPEGRRVAIVFCFKSINYALLITVFSVGGGS
jgi:hypothetical protein